MPILNMQEIREDRSSRLSWWASLCVTDHVAPVASAMLEINHTYCDMSLNVKDIFL